MYRAFLETVNRCPDKAAVSIIYNRLEAEKALKRRRKGKKRRAEDRTFYPAPKDLTWSQLSKVVETYQKSITQAVTRNSPRQAPCSVLFCACSGSFRLLVAWLATLGTGNIPVFANPLFTAKQLKEVFTEARPALVFMEIRAVNRRHLVHIVVKATHICFFFKNMCEAWSQQGST